MRKEVSMEEQKRNVDGLTEFLDFARKNGYVNAGTANNRIRIVKEVVSVVPNIDTNDVTKLDIDDVFNRYAILMASKLPATTLQGNKSHFKNAIREFDTYLADPVHYKPKSGKVKKDATSKIPVQKPHTEKKQPTAKITDSEIPPQKQDVLHTPTIHIDFQIHISPDTDATLVDKIFESLSKYFPIK